MSTQVAVFNFESYSLNPVVNEDEILFNANEVCAALGYANPWDAVSRHVHDDDLVKREVIDSMGRDQVANFVTESGLYALIFGSTKEESRKFKRWVTHEVIPAIRKQGFYESPAYVQMKADAEKVKLLEKQTRTLQLENKTLAATNVELADRNEYLEDKKAMFIDDHLRNCALSELNAEMVERRRLEEQMYLDECGDTSLDVKGCIKFVKQRAKATHKHLADLEKCLKKSGYLSTIEMYTDRIRDELGFYRNW